ncbi:MAG: hypothetical protein ACI9J3_003592 [Parvicellaceae bacterium]|jgi:hypothetical protein
MFLTLLVNWPSGSRDDKIYRNMAVGADGFPAIRQSSSGLGARIGEFGQLSSGLKDIHEVSPGVVTPFSGGMSANTDPIFGGVPWAGPFGFGDGTSKHPHWSLNPNILKSHNLQYVPDNDGSTHGTVQPLGPISTKQYQKNLESTKHLWRNEGGGKGNSQEFKK